MTPQLPLSDAQRRLGRPGRPTKGTGRAQGTDGTRVNGGAAGSGQDSESGRPEHIRLDERRLLDVRQTAAYLGDLGIDTVYELDASGVLTPARVVITGKKGQQLRKVVFDRTALDRLIDGWRNPA